MPRLVKKALVHGGPKAILIRWPEKIVGLRPEAILPICE